MWRITAPILMTLALATPVGAGAWMRDKGDGFLSVTSALRFSKRIYQYETDIFAELGLSADLTLGMSYFNVTGRAGHVLAFLRRRLPLASDSAHMALELGIGGHHLWGEWHPLYKVGFAYGRGFSWGQRGHGWLGIETAMEHPLGSADPIFKLDATLGRSSGARIRPMLKINTSYIPGQPLVWSASTHLMVDTRRDITWVLGLEYKRAGVPSTAVSLGFWRAF